MITDCHSHQVARSYWLVMYVRITLKQYERYQVCPEKLLSLWKAIHY